MEITNVYDCDFIFAELDLEIEECKINWSKAKLKQKIDLRFIYFYII